MSLKEAMLRAKQDVMEMNFSGDTEFTSEIGNPDFVKVSVGKEQVERWLVYLEH